MPDQLSFLGFEPPPILKPTDRVFFAIYLDAAARTDAAQVAGRQRAEHGLRGGPRPTDNLHVTLQHLGDFNGLPNAVIARALVAAAAVSSSSFEVCFDRVASFRGRPGNRPLVLRGDEGLVRLVAFQKTLGEALTKVGIGVDAKFTPHVTLLYDDKTVVETPIDPISWWVTEFVLIHSLLGRTQHLPLGRWTLKD